MNEILFRSAAPSDVRPERREIDVLAVPYDTPTAIADYDGSSYEETIARGAFAGVSDRAGRIKVLRDHDPKRAVGKCLSLDTEQTDGLHATLRIAPGSALGDETLALAADGVLDVSIGFAARASTWNIDRSRVQRTSCWLVELSLVPLPAYETANVLAVRGQLETVPPTSATPRLDELRDWYVTMRYRPDLT